MAHSLTNCLISEYPDISHGGIHHYRTHNVAGNPEALALHAVGRRPPCSGRREMLSHLDDGHLAESRGSGVRVEGSPVVMASLPHDAVSGLCSR